MISHAERILIVVLDNLGDTIMATSLVRPLHAAYPNAQIGLWVKRYTADVFGGFPVDHLHASDPFWDAPPGGEKGSLLAFLRTMREIRALRYDTVILVNTEWRRALAALICGIKQRVGYKRRRSSLFLTHGFPVPQGGHTVDDHRNLFELMTGLSPAPMKFSPFLTVSPDEKSWRDAWLDRMGWRANPVVGVHLFTGNPNRCWPLAKWAELIDRLHATSPQLRFAIFASAAERKFLSAFSVKAMPRDAVVVEESSLSRVKALISGCAFFVGADSGPGHTAGALGVPMVSLFGPTDPARYMAGGPGPVKVIRHQPVQELAVDVVEKEVRASMNAARAAVLR